ncbi:MULTISPECIES: PTS ascorbate transporter subunit IIC [unclassified Gilliamella]|uniref:PTS ascorbate transporter subunit IIC n=1 Tax=unclassified Gilliamella TaxID=2685620 RepID=UPI00226A7F80|nr:MULTISPECIES: PTS transporter subunit IIC [unclassified Gilliamella]MCX8602002.1 hypothetical protein [Gilliamella sp. B3722]MCX8607928.1 hypothetical protein [Gilliamella sp. B3771]MCX8611271.1 hypothetical protein [Gilliamella sp. B3891]MCX8613843.1 hypothetical protein [Gilliamella sp. B3773]MCX8616049.1 hypothetical protein [Gilliamella sp. B3770]
MDLFLNIFGQPAIIIALVAFIGLVLQRAKLSKIITGTLLSFIGFVLIKTGGKILGGVLVMFSNMFTHAFGMHGVVPSNEAITALTMESLGASAAFILFFAMIINLLLARFTRFKSIYLSLHLILFMAFSYTAVLKGMGYDGVIIVASGAIIIGFYMAIFPTLLSRFSQKIIGHNDYCIAHAGTISYLIGAYSGRLIGNAKNDIEQIKINDRFSFLRQADVATFITMFVLLCLSGLFSQPEYLKQILKNNTFIIFALEQSAIFAGGLYIAKKGVAIFTEEIIPAFKGFAQVVAPGCVPAVDPMVLFDKAPNCVLVGFIVSFFTEVACVVIFPFIGLPIIIPGIMASFITGGTAAIFGNSTGGAIGAIIAAFINGLLLCILPALALPLFAFLGVEGVTFADPDFTTLSLLTEGVMKLFH